MSLKNLDEYLQYDLRIKAIGMLLVKSLIHILTLLNLELFIKLRYIQSRTSADFDISDTILLTYIVAGIYSLGKIRYKRYFDISGIRYIRFPLYFLFLNITENPYIF